MNTWAVQPLDSYRLGQYQLPVPCYLCGEDNLHDAAGCRKCTAPMALTMAVAQSHKTKPQLMIPIGASAVGKSVYLGVLLDILSRQRERSDILTHGAPSVTLQQATLTALSRSDFPQATAKQPEDWTWAHCRLQRRTRKTPLEIFLPDLPGAAIMEEANQPNTHDAIAGAMANATGVMLFVDVGRAQAGEKEEEFFALKLLSHLEDTFEKAFERGNSTSKRRKGTPELPPVAIVLSKADLNDDCMLRPRDYARGELPGLWQHCRDRFPRHEFFALSVIGTCADVEMPNKDILSIPLRVEPRGVMEPFRWLIRQFLH